MKPVWHGSTLISCMSISTELVVVNWFVCHITTSNMHSWCQPLTPQKGIHALDNWAVVHQCRITSQKSYLILEEKELDSQFNETENHTNTKYEYVQFQMSNLKLPHSANFPLGLRFLDGYSGTLRTILKSDLETFFFKQNKGPQVTCQKCSPKWKITTT